MKTARSTDVNSNRRFKTERYEGGNPSSGKSEEARAIANAKDGSERLFNAMAKSIERLARRKRVSFDDACVMAQNCVGV